MHTRSSVLKFCRDKRQAEADNEAEVTTEKGWKAPEVSRCYFLLGKCYLAEHDKEMTLASFDVALKLDPGNAKVGDFVLSSILWVSLCLVPLSF